jgi:hypothetical protein
MTKNDEPTMGDVLGPAYGPVTPLPENRDPFDPHWDLPQEERDMIEATNVADWVVENECDDKSGVERQAIWHAVYETQLALKKLGRV